MHLKIPCSVSVVSSNKAPCPNHVLTVTEQWHALMLPLMTTPLYRLDLLDKITHFMNHALHTVKHGTVARSQKQAEEAKGINQLCC